MLPDLCIYFCPYLPALANDSCFSSRITSRSSKHIRLLPPFLSSIASKLTFFSEEPFLLSVNTQGVQANISAYDINLSCCATAIIAQNQYAFTGGKNARDLTYLTHADVNKAISPLLPALQSETLSILPTPQLNPHCSTVSTSSPGVGKETTIAQVLIKETCSAYSYKIADLSHQIAMYSKHFGKGSLSQIHFFVVGVSEKKEVEIMLYVVGRWTPFTMRNFPSTGK